MPGAVPMSFFVGPVSPRDAMGGWLSFVLQYLLRLRTLNDALLGLRFHQVSPLLRLLTTSFRLHIFASIAQ